MRERLLENPPSTSWDIAQGEIEPVKVLGPPDLLRGQFPCSPKFYQICGISPILQVGFCYFLRTVRRA